MLLVTTVNVAAGIAFSVFGAVINGFQRYDLNNIVGTASGIATAIVNLIVLSLGFGLVGLVVRTTTVLVLTCFGFTGPTPIACFPASASGRRSSGANGCGK